MSTAYDEAKDRCVCVYDDDELWGSRGGFIYTVYFINYLYLYEAKDHTIFTDGIKAIKTLWKSMSVCVQEINVMSCVLL